MITSKMVYLSRSASVNVLIRGATHGFLDFFRDHEEDSLSEEAAGEIVILFPEDGTNLVLLFQPCPL